MIRNRIVERPALRIAAIFMISGTTRGARAGLLPRWFVLVSYAAALALSLTSAQHRAVTLVFPTWVAAISLVVLLRRRVARARDVV